MCRSKLEGSDSLIKSIAGSLKIVNHVGLANASDAVVVIGPEHGRVFDDAGWTKEQAVEALHKLLKCLKSPI